MGATAIAMPKLGMTMQEGRVVEWPVTLGARVEKGETVLIIESEKAEVEVEATASGHLRHIYVEADETVPCGSLLAALTETADEDFDAEAYHRENHHPEDAATPAAAPAARPVATGNVDAPPSRASATPAARRRAKQLGVDAAQVPGTGPGGRVTAEDVEAFAASQRDRVKVADGVALEAPRQGSGAPLLLLPGFGTDVSVFARQIPALAESYEVIGVNPRGVGVSDAPDLDSYPVTQAADDAAVVSEEPAHVVGTSLGAAVALELALRHPGRVRSLTLVAPFWRANGHLLAVTDAWCRLAAEASPELLATALLPWFFSPAFLEDDAGRARTVRGLATTLARVSAASLARTAAGLRDWSPPQDSLASLEIPTLVIVGGADLLTPDGAEVARAIPGARCVEIEAAGHALGLEAPDAVNAALRDHLAALD